MEKEIKIPQQERSMQKKQLIIQTGFQLFCKNGYYHTNTAEIAKAAGISTGIIYRYFPDKKAIFVAGLQHYMDESTQKIKELLESVPSFDNMETILGNLINMIIEIHYLCKEVHEEVNVMVHSDEDIANIYYDWEDHMTQVLVNCLSKLNLQTAHNTEKVHMIIHLVENYCHEIVFHQHPDMDYDSMKRILIQTILFILQV